MCNQLYIPIWLYSNYEAITVSVISSIFTFQSGYIQIDKLMAEIGRIDNFTFQSGYIQIMLILEQH